MNFSTTIRVGIFVLATALVLNIFFLDVVLFKTSLLKTSVPQTAQGGKVPEQNNASQTSIEDSNVSASVCPVGCLVQIKEATKSLSVTATVKPSLTPTKTPAKPSSDSTSVTVVREYYIPFGGGTNQTDDWQDVGGIQSYIDSTAYGKIKEVRFEASVFIPTGNEIVYVRLYNVTDKHPVWFSEVSHEGGAAKLLISDPITLDNGNKVYQVQMKTSLKFLAQLNQSRVHITTY